MQTMPKSREEGVNKGTGVNVDTQPKVIIGDARLLVGTASLGIAPLDDLRWQRAVGIIFSNSVDAG